MKQTTSFLSKFFLTITFFFSFSSLSQAQNTQLQDIEGQKTYIVADVSLSDGKILKQDGLDVQASFIVNNGEGAQAEAKYGVALVDSKNNMIVDEWINPESFSLSPHGTKEISLKYTIPANFSGIYVLLARVANDEGIPLGSLPLGSVQGVEAPKGVEILKNTCYLQISKSTIKHEMLYGVDVGQNEKLTLVCAVVNHEKDTITAVPFFETRHKVAYGDVIAPPVKGSPVTLSGLNRKEISFDVPTVKQGGLYYVDIWLDSQNGVRSNSVGLKYNTPGFEFSIYSIVLDKDGYMQGDSASVSVLFQGLGPGFRSSTTSKNIPSKITISLFDRNGNLCADAVTESVTKGDSFPKILVPVIQDCASPRVHASLLTAGGAIIDTKEAQFETKEGPRGFGWLVVGLVVLLALGFGVSLAFRKKKERFIMPATMFILAGCFLIPGTAHGVTYSVMSTDGSNVGVSVEINLHDTYRIQNGNMEYVSGWVVSTRGDLHSASLYGGIDGGGAQYLMNYPYGTYAPPSVGSHNFTVTGSAVVNFYNWGYLSNPPITYSFNLAKSLPFQVTGAPLINTIDAANDTIFSGASTVISWSSSYADSCTLNGGAAQTTGSRETDLLTETTNYRLVCQNAYGTTERALSVSVISAPATLIIPDTPPPAGTVNVSIEGEGVESAPWSITGSVNFSNVWFIGGGTWASYAIKDDGTVWAWGNSNTSGELGDGTTTARSYPGPVLDVDGSSQLRDVSYVGGSVSSAYAIRESDGAVLAWGNNWAGQLGNGTTERQLIPVQVLSPTGAGYLTGVKAISRAPAGSSVMAVKTDGTVWAWGRNDNGELGNGSTTDSSRPVRVGASIDFGGVVAVSYGQDTGYALKGNGEIWAWGLNSSGQIGDGTTTNRPTPVKISGTTSYKAIAAGAAWAHALGVDGSVYGWGSNFNGEVGDGTTSQRNTPVRTSSLSGVVSISAGNGVTFAVKSDGTVWGWGWNAYGQLGDGTTTNRPTPIQIRPGLLSGIKSVVGMSSGGIALKDDSVVYEWSSYISPRTVKTRPGISSGAGDAVYTAQPTGSYNITWGEVPGFDTPPPETLVTLTDGGQITFMGNYVAIQKPDLVGEISSAAAGTVDSPIAIISTVLNIGNLEARNFKNLFRLGASTDPGAIMMVTQDFDTTVLGAGGDPQELTYSWTTDTAGVYYAQICADESSTNSSGVINNEFDEDNNCSSWQTIVVEAEPLACPDACSADNEVRDIDKNCVPIKCWEGTTWDGKKCTNE